MIAKLPTIALIAAAAAVPIAALSAPAGTTSTAAGVYTGAQASEGAELYAGQCAMCHGAALAGTNEIPTLVSGRFVGNWQGPLSALFDYIHRAMPQMAPATLAPEDNARIVAFLLRQNGMPAGKTALPGDSKALKAIVLEPVKR